MMIMLCAVYSVVVHVGLLLHGLRRRRRRRRRYRFYSYRVYVCVCNIFFYSVRGRRRYCFSPQVAHIHARTHIDLRDPARKHHAPPGVPIRRRSRRPVCIINVYYYYYCILYTTRNVPSSTAAADNATTCPHNIMSVCRPLVDGPETERGNETVKNCTTRKKGRLCGAMPSLMKICRRQHNITIIACVPHLQ